MSEPAPSEDLVEQIAREACAGRNEYVYKHAGPEKIQYEMNIDWMANKPLYMAGARAVLASTPIAQQTERAALIADYEAMQVQNRKLVRRLDVALNGDGAARQASLCDLVSQFEDKPVLTERIERLEAALRELVGAVSDCLVPDIDMIAGTVVEVTARKRDLKWLAEQHAQAHAALETR